MAKGFTHLTLEERQQIRIFRLQKMSSSAIAKILGRSKSTISDEVRRHLHHNGYEPVRAQGHAQVVRKIPRKPQKMDVPVIEKFVKEGLLASWSPEQIAWRMRVELPRSSAMRISHQCIYDRLEYDKKNGGAWYKLLRINNKKRKRPKVKRLPAAHHHGGQRRGICTSRRTGGKARRENVFCRPLLLLATRPQ